MMGSPRAALLLVAALSAPVRPSSFAEREEAYRANNVGVALLEQYRFEEAAARFRRALEVDPGLGIARLNLAVALLNLPDLEGARREAGVAASVLPQAPQPPYVLGLVAKSQNRTEDAVAAFKRVLALDPADVGSHVNLGQLHLQQRRYEEAIAAFRVALAAEPYSATATYNLGIALTRAGQREEGQRLLARFQELREKGYGTAIGTTYPEQGRYAEAVASTGAEPDLVDPQTPAVKFVDATATALGGVSRLGGRPTLFDFDGDGALDLLDVGPSGQRLYRNEGGRFVDMTRGAGLKEDAAGIGAVPGDYDNDGRVDLFVLRPGGGMLLHNDGGRFSDVTASAGLLRDSLALSAAFADVDHDGDLDLFLAGFVDPGPPASNRLLRNNGNGTFTEVTAAAGLAGHAAQGLSVVPTDYDNRRDLDLLVLPRGRGPALFRNLRDGTFREVAAEAGLPTAGQFTSVAAADVDKDGRTDFFFGGASGPGVLALSEGQERFRLLPGPAAAAASAQFLDYDNDGLLDLLTLAEDGLHVLRNVGGGKWWDVSRAAVPGGEGGSCLASGDLDGDGDLDLVVRLTSGELRLWHNEGGNRNRSLRVDLSGRVSNRAGVGAKVEMRAGSLRQKLENAAATPAFAPAQILFGLGKREAADTVRVLWPSGTAQAELEPALRARVAVVELDRKPSSCPFLYAWNGQRFDFVTDFLGGGEMGYWQGPGRWNTPVPEEHVRLRDDQLVARGGRYELRVTNELEEALFLDRLRLIAVTHPADVEVFPDEGLIGSRRPFKLHALRNPRPPRSAVDEHGRDVLSRVARLDREFVDGFALLPLRGYAEEHAVTLDLGEPPERALLLLTGWTDYAFSSDNVAAHQRGLALHPPALQVEDGEGRWRTVVDNIGIPVGRPQTVVLDLAGLWPGRSGRVRIVTNMRIYWDQILVAAGAEVPRETASLEPLAAELRERGFSAETSPDGREPFAYDYARVARTSPWKVIPGRYTREGDVRELLRASDDLFVISRPGDEVAVSFDAGALPPLREGWRRTFLLHADGFSKEMDINSATPDALGPLPFHAMTRYPYHPPEAYPMSPERLAVMERYNTRLVRAPLAAAELALEE